jgi:hypothetical protein
MEMATEEKIAATYKALGEFIIIFQWVEDIYRQIGWFILDPERKNWPPMELRKETTLHLINKVTDMFVELTQTYSFPNGDEKAKDILELRGCFHELRTYRNNLVHSTYVEVKGIEKLYGYIRSNPKVGVDTETGELIFDQEDFTAEVIRSKIGEYGDCMLRLNLLHMQLIHWAPFARHRAKTGT